MPVTHAGAWLCVVFLRRFEGKSEKVIPEKKPALLYVAYDQ